MTSDRCDECAQVRPAFGFVTLTSEEPGAARHLCSECYGENDSLQSLSHASVDLAPGISQVSSRAPCCAFFEPWEEFGEFLSSFTGFDFRLECFDASES